MHIRRCSAHHEARLDHSGCIIQDWGHSNESNYNATRFPHHNIDAVHQRGFLFIVERTQPEQVRAVAFQHDIHPFGQALQEDLGFQAVELIVGNASYIFPPSSKKIGSS